MGLNKRWVSFQDDEIVQVLAIWLDVGASARLDPKPQTCMALAPSSKTRISVYSADETVTATSADHTRMYYCMTLGIVIHTV